MSAPFEQKICPPPQLAARLASCGRPLVFTNGVFDILHRGHVTYLADSRALLLRRAILQLASRKALPQLVQSGGERFGDFAHGEVDLLHLRFPGSDPGRAHALPAQLGEPRLRGLLGLEYAQRNGEPGLGILLQDEEILHAELFQLGGFPVGRLTAALRRHKHPVARDFLRAALGEFSSERERLQKLLHARYLAGIERPELQARGDGDIGRRRRRGQRLGARGNLLGALGCKRGKLLGAEQRDRLRVELLLHQLRLGGSTTPEIAPREEAQDGGEQQEKYGSHKSRGFISAPLRRFALALPAPDYPRAAREC